MITKLLSELVKFKTLSNDFAENQRALNWIKKQLQGLPVKFVSVNVNKHPALVVYTKSAKYPKLLLQGHIDVVDGPPSVFQPKIKSGKLFGHGVFDMKYATACYIQLFQDLGPDLKNFDLAMMITTDEEIGGRDGVGALVKAGYKPEICFLPDGGEDWTLQRSAKGIYQIRVISQGRSGHSSRPWTGVNAIDQINSFATELKNKFVVEPCHDKEHNHNTITLSRIAGGKIINQIPAEAEADFDIRFTGDSSLDQVRKLVKSVVDKFSGLSIVELGASDSYKVDLQNKDYKLFLELLKKRGKKIKFIDSHGSSDARYFLNNKIPTIVLRPVGGGHHTNHEWIDIKHLEQFYDLLKEFVEKIARAK